MPGRIVSIFRDADWLGPERARAYARILAAVVAVLLVGAVALSHDGLDHWGKPIGTDFLSFWTASKLALNGHAGEVYRPLAHAAAERAAFRGADLGYSAFFYPPPFLLICLPLALLPYLGALAAWLGATGALCWLVLRRWLDRSVSMLAAFAFPATFSNLGHGQNAFLSTALFGAGGLMLASRPFVAGLCFGALVFKPHLGLLIPIALLAGGRWRAIAGAAVSAVGLAIICALMFGIDIWRGFLDVSPLARATLEHELVGSAKMVSVFAAIRLWHGPLWLAYGLQGLMALAVAAVVAQVFRRARNTPAAGAVLVAGAVLASPFLLDYDLMLGAVPMAWLLSQGLRTGFRPWEKSGLAAAFILPLIVRMTATYLLIPLGPIVMSGLFLLVLRRAWETPSAPRRPPLSQGAAGG